MTDEEKETGEEQPEAEEQKLSRRARRAAQAGATDSSDPSQIKDRNQRLRAERSKGKTRAQERSEARATGLGKGERVDDVLSRSAASTGKFFQSQFAWLQWVIVLGVGAVIGAIIYGYRQDKTREKVGDRVAAALEVATGRVASAEPAQPADRNLVDTRREFATSAARSEATEKAFAELQDLEQPELRLWAALGRAAALFDDKKWDEAKKAYEAVLADAAGTKTIHARAKEGVGLVAEAQEQYDAALAAYDGLGSFGLAEFKNLGRFHTARVRFLKGEKDKAKEELTQLSTELKKGESPLGSRSYLSLAVEDLLKTIDPKAQSELSGISPEQLEELRRQIEAMQKNAELPGLPEGSTP